MNQSNKVIHLPVQLSIVVVVVRERKVDFFQVVECVENLFMKTPFFHNFIFVFEDERRREPDDVCVVLVTNFIFKVLNRFEPHLLHLPLHLLHLPLHLLHLPLHLLHLPLHLTLWKYSEVSGNNQ
jgi:hypothetical protein